MRIAGLALVALAVLPAQAPAQNPVQNPDPAPDPAQARYHTCMALTRVRPNDAFDQATEWENLGGGYPARHCALAALVELGHYPEAAQGLEKLAERVAADAPFKAHLLLQAARAWIAAEDAERAMRVIDAALALTPEAPDGDLAPLLIARARAYALQEAFWDATDDLSRVLYVDPRNAEALVLRGAAYRQLSANDLALDDLNRALALEPRHPEGLLERGIVRRLNGDKAGARNDWRALVDAHPESEAARLAAANLHALDSGLE